MSDTEESQAQPGQANVPETSGSSASTKDDKQDKHYGKIIELKRNKRSRKTAVTKVRHSLERLCAKKGELDIESVEGQIAGLWELLEQSMSVMDELSHAYLQIGKHDSHATTNAEAENFESETLQAIERAEGAINEFLRVTPKQASDPSTTVSAQLTPTNQQNSVAAENNTGNNVEVSSKYKLDPLKVPVFDGDKTRFEDFWGLFISLVDSGNEPANIKMARLRQSLKGTALEAIRGLGVSSPEYEEAKEILNTKFGGQRRQLQAYMDQLEAMPSLKGGDVQGFERFADLVRITVVKLRAEGRDGELGEGTLHGLLVKKLAERQVESYSRWLREHKKERSVLSLNDWLKEEVRVRVEAVEMVHGVEGIDLSLKRNEVGGGKSRYGDRGRSRTLFAGRGGVGSKDVKPPCALCEGNHGIWYCQRFQGMKVQDRWDIAKAKHLCFRCLGSDHQGRACLRSKACKTDGCTKNHHTLLHDSVPQVKRSEDKNPVVSGEGETESRTHTTTHDTPTTEALSLRTIPVWLKANNRKVKINALLDDASNETFLNAEVAGVLDIQEPLQTVKVHVLNDEIETFESMPVTVTIESVDGQFSKEINVKTCPRRVTGNYKEDWSVSKRRWEHLKRCDFAKPANEGMVDLLIGTDNTDLHYSRADIRGEPGAPIARLGPLGWTCIGIPDREDGSQSRTHVIRTLLTRDPTQRSVEETCCEVDRSIKRFWEVENYDTAANGAKVHTEEEQLALRKMESSISHDGTRYKIGVPWKENRPKLKDNYEEASARLCNTEKKLRKDKFLGTEYQKTIEAYIEKGYLRRVESEEEIPPEVWYLPHFPVVRMDKTTSKVRIVFDCSAKSNGVALNDVIYAGPKLQKELIDVLIRFRRKPVAVACDVREMYLQVEIEECDRPMFRLLWRDLDSNRDPEVYEFNRVVFGKNSAPMESQFVAQENARRHQETYPMAAETVLKSTYMDDSIDSVETDEEGIELYQQLRDLWNLAGMQARKWISNSPAVNAATPEEERATELSITDNSTLAVKTLGLSWHSSDDVLTISSPGHSSEVVLTKRNVLKKIATVFDPLGFISPFVVIAKILLQELWSRGYDWDDVIADEVAEKIEMWFRQLLDLENVRVPRCLREAKTVLSQSVITFVDASLKAYGAVVYLKCEYEDTTTSCRMIASKTKVAPLKPMTVPRLELMGAILGLRLTQRLSPVLEIPMSKVTFYSDSTDVLWWIRGHGRDFRSFIANRIGEIQMSTEPAQWQHMRTDENPADLCTRGATPSELADNCLWWNGPKWLLEDKSSWPKMQIGTRPKELPEAKPSNRVAKEEMIVTATVCHYQRPVEDRKVDKQLTVWRLDPTRYSNWSRLVRVFGRVRRFAHNTRNSKTRVTDQELLPEELRDAEESIIGRAQRDVFSNEYKTLKTGKQMSPKSTLLKLNPRLDEQGLIRSDSRLRFAEFLPYDVRFPIILPRGHWVTKLIVKHFHELSNHSAGTNFILSQLNQRYWIPAAREEIREWETECNTCKRKRNKAGAQIMGPLPPSRLRPTYRAFDQAAVDYAGRPFQTIQGRGKRRNKRWLCVFTCMATRAVHLEVAWGLDTDSLASLTPLLGSQADGVFQKRC